MGTLFVALLMSPVCQSANFGTSSHGSWFLEASLHCLEGPSTHYLRTLVPTPILVVVLWTRELKFGYLDPLCCTNLQGQQHYGSRRTQGALMMMSPHVPPIGRRAAAIHELDRVAPPTLTCWGSSPVGMLSGGS